MYLSVLVACWRLEIVGRYLDGDVKRYSNRQCTLSHRPDVLRENPFQENLIQDQNVIQTLFSDSSDPALNERIRIWGLIGCGNHVDTFGLKKNIESCAKASIVVADQQTKGGFLIIQFPNELPGLLGGPKRIWIGGDPRQIHSAGVQFNEDEYKDGLQSDPR